MQKKRFIKVPSLLLSIIILFLLNKSSIVLAEETTNYSSSLPKSQYKSYFCPFISELVRSGLWWSARDQRWKSYSPSFATEIDYFVGAEWFGVNVGKIICIYQGKGGVDFPVSLEPSKTILILEPQHKNWTSPRAGYKLCKSTNVVDCPFSTQLENKKNPYEEIKYHGEAGKITENN